MKARMFLILMLTLSLVITSTTVAGQTMKWTIWTIDGPASEYLGNTWWFSNFLLITNNGSFGYYLELEIKTGDNTFSAMVYSPYLGMTMGITGTRVDNRIRGQSALPTAAPLPFIGIRVPTPLTLPQEDE